jgi:hypothetical protein
MENVSWTKMLESYPGFFKVEVALLMGIIDYLIQSVCDYILL